MSRKRNEKAAKHRKIGSLVLAGTGIALFWTGMWKALWQPDPFFWRWLAAAMAGLILVVAAYPVRKGQTEETSNKY